MTQSEFQEVCATGFDKFWQYKPGQYNALWEAIKELPCAAFDRAVTQIHQTHKGPYKPAIETFIGMTRHAAHSDYRSQNPESYEQSRPTLPGEWEIIRKTCDALVGASPEHKAEACKNIVQWYDSHGRPMPQETARKYAALREKYQVQAGLQTVTPDANADDAPEGYHKIDAAAVLGEPVIVPEPEVEDDDLPF